MWIEIMPLRTAYTETFLILFSQIPFLMNQFLISSQAIVSSPMRKSYMSFASWAFFSDHVTKLGMLFYLSLLINSAASAFNISILASLPMLLGFIIAENFCTPLVATGKLDRVQNLMCKTMNLIKGDIFATKRASISFFTRSTTRWSGLPRILKPLIQALTAKSSLTLTTLLGLVQHF